MALTPLWEDVIHGGASWSVVLRRGNALVLEDLEGGANVAALFYNYECLVERYNMPDTLKCQHTAHLTAGHCLYSDMGRILCSITADTVGWHDPLAGVNDAASAAAKYGAPTYQEQRNAWVRNTRDNLLTEAQRYGMGVRDLGPTVNFFSKVVVRLDGAMDFVPDNSKAGDTVTLRAEMDTLILLDTGQHALDPNPVYSPKSVKISVVKAGPVAADDLCRLHCAENGRGFINTERYFA